MEYIVARYKEGSREGILLNKGENWGEIAPLPGWSRETLKEAELQLKQYLEGEVPFEKLYPSVAFGVESVQYPLPGKIDLPVSSLLMGTYEEIVKQAETIPNRSVKLKISQLSKEEARDLIYRYKDRFSLRIDLNRAWELQEAVDFFKEFSAKDFDYIEEPLKNPAQLKDFSLPVAVDESLLEVDLASLSNLKAIVYKPTFFGGLSRCRTFLCYGKPIVLSSAFESKVGVLNIVYVAQTLGLTSPLGLANKIL